MKKDQFKKVIELAQQREVLFHEWLYLVNKNDQTNSGTQLYYQMEAIQAEIGLLTERVYVGLDYTDLAKGLDLYQIVEREEAKDGTSLVGKVNIGYTIKLQGMLAVIGWSETKQEYVTWSYDIINGEASYFWGRYGNTFDEIKKKYDLKENGEYSG